MILLTKSQSSEKIENEGYSAQQRREVLQAEQFSIQTHQFPVIQFSFRRWMYMGLGTKLLWWRCSRLVGCTMNTDYECDNLRTGTN